MHEACRASGQAGYAGQLTRIAPNGNPYALRRAHYGDVRPD